MFRSAAPRLAMLVLVSVATVPLAATSAGAAEEHKVRVFDNGFEWEGAAPGDDPATVVITEGDSVTWELDPDAANDHSIAIDADNDGVYSEKERALAQDLSPDGKTTASWFFNSTAAPEFQYTCLLHEAAMVGTVVVNSPDPSTTTTTAPPTTTTTTEPPTTTTTEPPTTTTTRRTTTTTRPPNTQPPSTQPPATTTTRPSTTTTEPSQSNTGSSNGTGRTTTTAEPTTSTTRRARSPESTNTTEAQETTTTTLDPALLEEWIPTPEIGPDGQATTSTTSSGDEAASAADDAGTGSGGGDGLPVVPLAGALAVILLGGGSWAWYHRSSRYLSA